MGIKFRRLIQSTVFNPFDAEAHPHPNERLSVLFHRSAATLYFIYALWGAFTTSLGIPSIIATTGDPWQFGFSALVLLVCLAACIGATFFPRLAKLELYGASSFSSLLLFYLALIIVASATDLSKLGGLVLISSVVVIPIARVSFIFFAFIRTTEGDK